MSTIPREIAFCSHVLNGEGPLIVLDAADDPRFVGNPLVRAQPGIRFYAGTPLFSPIDGEYIGALCVSDTEPCAWLSMAERTALVDLAAETVGQLERSRLAMRVWASREGVLRTSRDSVLRTTPSLPSCAPTRAGRYEPRQA